LTPGQWEGRESWKRLLDFKPMLKTKNFPDAAWETRLVYVGIGALVSGILLLPLMLHGNSNLSIPATPGWFSVPDSSLQSVCPPETAQYDFAANCRNVIAAWNSAIADTKRSRLIIWGGGHADYAGNELYALDLGTLRMQRLNEPSPVNTSGKCVEMLSDGRPNSRHTYGGLAYITHADRMFSFGGSLNQCGFFTNATWTFDLETLQWKNMSPAGGAPAALPGAVSDYDPNSQSVFLHDTTDFWQYDYDKNRYKKVGANISINYRMNGVIDPKRRIFFIFGAASMVGGGLKAISIAPGSNYAMQDWTGRASNTCGPLLSANYPGLAYDSALDRIVGWPNFGDEVYLFDPDTKSCTAQTFSGGPPDSAHVGSPHTTNGTFGRFRYFAKSGVFALVNQANSNAYLLRLPAPAADAARH
jgi:hypothetical protein